ncbi:polysaccharide deacetylase family protein [Neobacillus sp. PS2-9]|uniref:polysaccharide deacetylase family protein n=1 Tax=Neobacillus sp. PS2-9 TaxID=3070676 RepID=UPI0027E0B1B4|nr:polysaccharide deacetylase family protein [Neobacillus sp. PS2-9]WML56536.1 polysaccharide deacetylase family protein [Neobacillus sp. PS2-9]
MLDALILLAILLLSLFLILGVVSYFKQNGLRWLYFILASICLVGIIFMLFYHDWNLNFLAYNDEEKNDPPKIEIPSGNDKQNETDPGKQQTPVKDSPSVDEPDEEKPDQPTPSTPVNIQIPEDEIIEYTVVKGDTLWSIASKASVTVEKIKNWNNLSSDTIYVGQVLKLYGKNVEPPRNQPNQETPPTTGPSVIISNGKTNQKEIALTFDAGSDAAGISILDVLKKHNVKATFFLTGKWVEKYPSFAKRITNEGHEIGNHSYSHPDAVKTTANAFKQDILKAEQIIKNTTGKSPRPFFRFPYGSYNTDALKIVGEAGYSYSVQWSLDTIDWQQPSTDVIIERIKGGASNGDILLMHIGGINTPAAVDQVIPWLKTNGYQLVPLSEILK